MSITGWKRLSLALGAILLIAVVIIVLGVNPIPANLPTFTAGGNPQAGSPATTSTSLPPVAPYPSYAAPELPGIENWINSEPLEIARLRGKVVLIDFWTYTCINCIRTFPYLRQWHDKYAGSGLVIIGVHTPEFSFERKLENVKEAAAKHGLRYPIALDNNYETWQAYENRYWPHKYLIDKNGVIRFHHIGEGEYATTEMWIQRLLKEVNPALTEREIVEEPKAISLENLRRITPELYAGYLRGKMGNTSGEVEKDFLFTDPGRHEEDIIYLHGLWQIGREAIRHAAATGGWGDYIALKFSARSLNIVINPGTRDPFEVRVTLDGQNLNQSNKGADIQLTPEGYSYIPVKESRLYHVVNLPEFGTHEIHFRVNSDNFAFYAFTFGP